MFNRLLYDALITESLVRPLCGVACRAIQARPDIVVTLMTLGGLDDRITAIEGDRYSRSNDGDEEKEGMRRLLR